MNVTDPLQLLSELVAIPSPSGSESACSAFVLDWCASNGIEATSVGDSVVLRLGVRGGPRVLFASHLDTVPVGKGWSSDPFDGTWRVRTGDDGAWVDGPELAEIRRDGDAIAVRLTEGASIAPLLGRAAEAGAEVHAIERVLPTLHQLYLQRARALDPEASLDEGAA